MKNRVIVGTLAGLLSLGVAAPAFAYHGWFSRERRHERHEAKRLRHRCRHDPGCRDRAYYRPVGPEYRRF
jgi:hypothetical protein